jgi:hypothetical protein
VPARGGLLAVSSLARGSGLIPSLVEHSWTFSIRFVVAGWGLPGHFPVATPGKFCLAAVVSRADRPVGINVRDRGGGESGLIPLGGLRKKPASDRAEPIISV